MVPDGVTGVLDSDSIKRDLGCMKYKKESEITRNFGSCFDFDPSILHELCDEIAGAKGVAEGAKATADEGKKQSGEAKDAASEAAKAVVPVGVSVSEGVDSDRMKKVFDA
jgi:hypothetical protein